MTSQSRFSQQIKHQDKATMERLLGVPSNDDCDYLEGELNDSERRAATLSGIALLVSLVSLCVVLSLAISARDDNGQRLAVKIAENELSRQRRDTDIVQKQPYEGVMRSTLHLCKEEVTSSTQTKKQFEPIPSDDRKYGTAARAKNPITSISQAASKKLMQASCVIQSPYMARALMQKLTPDNANDEGLFLCVGRYLTKMTERIGAFDADPEADLTMGVKTRVCPLTDSSGQLIK